MAAAEVQGWADLPYDLIREIFSLLRPIEPVVFARVAHVCKNWQRALRNPEMALLLHNLDILPLPIGFFHNSADDDLPTFVSTLDSASPFSPKEVPDRDLWRILDYRHGLGLFVSRSRGDLGRKELLVWDPLTGLQQRLPLPVQASGVISPGAAIFCGAPGCRHQSGCPGDKFKVALLLPHPAVHDYEDEEEEVEMNCFLYASETGAWTHESSVFGFYGEFGDRPGVMAGGSLYFLSDGFVLFEFDIATSSLAQIELPEMDGWTEDDTESLILMVTEEDGVGLVQATGGNLFTWSRNTDVDGNDSWERTNCFDHYDLFGNIGLDSHSLQGFATGIRIFFVRSSDGNFTFRLPRVMVPPQKEPDLVVKKLRVDDDFGFVIPVVSFYAPFNGLFQDEEEQHQQQPPPLDENGNQETIQSDATKAQTDTKRANAMPASPESSKKRHKKV